MIVVLTLVQGTWGYATVGGGSACTGVSYYGERVVVLYIFFALLTQTMSLTPQPADGSFGAQPIPGRDTGDPEGSVMVDRDRVLQVGTLVPEIFVVLTA